MALKALKNLFFAGSSRPQTSPSTPTPSTPSAPPSTPSLSLATTSSKSNATSPPAAAQSSSVAPAPSTSLYASAPQSASAARAPSSLSSASRMSRYHMAPTTSQTVPPAQLTAEYKPAAVSTITHPPAKLPALFEIVPETTVAVSGDDRSKQVSSSRKAVAGPAPAEQKQKAARPESAPAKQKPANPKPAKTKQVKDIPKATVKGRAKAKAGNTNAANTKAVNTNAANTKAVNAKAANTKAEAKVQGAKSHPPNRKQAANIATDAEAAKPEPKPEPPKQLRIHRPDALPRLLCFSKVYVPQHQNLKAAGFFVRLPEPTLCWSNNLPPGVSVKRLQTLLEDDSEILSAQHILDQQTPGDTQFGHNSALHSKRGVSRWTNAHYLAARSPAINGAISGKKHCGVVVEEGNVDGVANFSVMIATVASAGENPAELASWYQQNVVPIVQHWKLSDFEMTMLRQPDVQKQLTQRHGVVLSDMFIGMRVDNIQHPTSQKLQAAFVTSYDTMQKCCTLRFGDQSTISLPFSKLGAGFGLLASGFRVEGRDHVQQALNSLSRLWSSSTQSIRFAYWSTDFAELLQTPEHFSFLQTTAQQHFQVTISCGDDVPAHNSNKKNSKKPTPTTNESDVPPDTYISGKPTDVEQCIEWFDNIQNVLNSTNSTFDAAACARLLPTREQHQRQTEQTAENKLQPYVADQPVPGCKDEEKAVQQLPHAVGKGEKKVARFRFGVDSIRHADELGLVPEAEKNALLKQIADCAPSVTVELMRQDDLLRLTGLEHEVHAAAEVAQTTVRNWASKIRSVMLNLSQEESKLLQTHQARLKQERGILVWLDSNAQCVVHATASSEDERIVMTAVEASADDLVDVDVLLVDGHQRDPLFSSRVWRNGVQKLIMVAPSALDRGLAEADRMPFSSISIGIPLVQSTYATTSESKQTAAQSIVQAALEYLSQNIQSTKLRRLVFFNLDPTTAQAFGESLHRCSLKQTPSQQDVFEWRYRTDHALESQGRPNLHEATTLASAQWVSYAPDVSAELERRYQNWLNTGRNMAALLHEPSNGYSYNIVFQAGGAPHYQQNTDARYLTKRRITRERVANAQSTRGLVIKMKPCSNHDQQTRARARLRASKWEKWPSLKPLDAIVTGWLQQQSTVAEVTLPDSIRHTLFDAKLIASAKSWLQTHASSVTVIRTNSSARSITIRGHEDDIRTAQATLPMILLGEFARLTDLGQKPPQLAPFKWANEDNGQNRVGVLVSIVQNCEEWRQVLQLGRWHETMVASNVVVGIERVENRALWNEYALHRDQMQQRHRRKWEELHKWAWHGTRTTDPNLIVNEGIDFRYSEEGLWGRGAYTAHNASYSHNYAHHSVGGGVRKMFLVNVLLGNSRDFGTSSNKTLRAPPAGHDSVTGYTQGSTVHIVYEIRQLYPAYLITYR